MYAVFVILAYIFGSIPFGLLAGRWISGQDPRDSGSGNLGATNVGRTCGFSVGVLTLALDLIKGLLPVALAVDAHAPHYIVSLTAFAAVFGHCYPLFLKFKGGKAVATTIGVFLPIAWTQIILAVLVLLAMLFITGYMSVASLSLSLSLFLFILVSKPVWALLALAIMLLIFWRHKENILRLARGEENHWRKK